MGMAEPTYFGAHLADMTRPLPSGDALFPVSIVGGGPVGMALAVALARHGIAARIHDARPRGAARQDPRVLALSQGTQQSLAWLGVWPTLARFATPIESIHISQQGGFGRTRLTAREQGVAALGQVVAAGHLAAVIDDALAAHGIEVHAQDAVQSAERVGNTAMRLRTAAGHDFMAQLVVYAEGAIAAAETETGAGAGAVSMSRRTAGDIVTRDYHQHALICNVTTRMPHGRQAWERFTPQGPLALLPWGGEREYAVVHACSPAEAGRLAALDEAAYLAVLQAHFGTRLQFDACTARQMFPLALRYRREPVGLRRVWLGNAAQTLHPVAGQGFNLALRDVRELARTLTGCRDAGAADVLARYGAARRCDRHGVIGFTDGVVRLFSNDLPLLSCGRGLGLLALDLAPALRGFIARRMMYGMRVG
jgi:2-octaprenyl-6-methoxyphenol hydroxylase